MATDPKSVATVPIDDQRWPRTFSATRTMPQGTLDHISPGFIVRNPDNPRLIFREDELDALMRSIHRRGVQVPIAVYKEGRKFVLIDGERRWRCASKLNLGAIPALIQERPTPLENLLLMFNIHALREQWDYLTIASKLPRVIELFEQKHEKKPTESELSEETGLTRGQIRRCHLILNLPERYRGLLLEELRLPKNHQKLSEDFLLEMERALKTVQRCLPLAVPDLNGARDVLISKYRGGTIRNVTDFRKLRKIATSVESLGIKKQVATLAIRKVIDPEKNVGIMDVFEQRFEAAYDTKRAIQSASSIYAYLEELAAENKSPPDSLKRALNKLWALLEQLVGDNQ